MEHVRNEKNQGDHPQNHQEQKIRHKTALITVPLIVVAFFVFFGMKICGFMDASRNYDIYRIRSNRDKGNVQAVIDHDEQTTWGCNDYWEKNKAGDYILFTFAKEKTLQQVTIVGKCPDDILFYEKQEDGWIQIPVDKEENQYFFQREVTTKELKIVTGEGAGKKKWDVKEIIFL